MKCVTSLWTSADVFSFDFAKLLVRTFSMLLARQSMGNIHLVTDDLGKHIAETLGWETDSLATSLEYLPKKLSHIWAVGKLFTSIRQAERFLQIDGDVLLFRRIKPVGAIFAQSVDNPEFYRTPICKALIQMAGLPPEQQAYNCGIIGGEPSSLNPYCQAGFDLCVEHFEPFKKFGTDCSIIAEQYQLGKYCADHRIEVGTLFRETPTDKEAARLGYCHLQGTSKTEGHSLSKIESKMREHFPKQHARFIEGITELENACAC